MVTPLRWDIEVDTTKLDAIIALNALRANTVGQVLPQQLMPEEPMTWPKALYTLPSMFNHACSPNAAYCSFKDVMVIRSLQDIKAGTEITLQYTPGVTAMERATVLDAVLEQQCDCLLCSQDRANPTGCKIRMELYQKGRSGGDSTMFSLLMNRTAMTKHLSSILATFPPGQEPCGPIVLCTYTMDGLSANIVGLKRSPAAWKYGIQQGFKALHAAGFVNIDKRMKVSAKERFTLPVGKEKIPECMDIQCCLAMTTISSSFLSLGEHICAQRWRRCAWWGE
jgi:hypothetical protein